MEETKLEPVNVEALFSEFSDSSLAELMMTIKDLRQSLDHEKKAHSFDELKLKKAEEQIEILTGRINSVVPILKGEADVCINCEAVREDKES